MNRRGFVVPPPIRWPDLPPPRKRTTAFRPPGTPRPSEPPVYLPVKPPRAREPGAPTPTPATPSAWPLKPVPNRPPRHRQPSRPEPSVPPVALPGAAPAPARRAILAGLFGLAVAAPAAAAVAPPIGPEWARNELEARMLRAFRRLSPERQAAFLRWCEAVIAGEGVAEASRRLYAETGLEPPDFAKLGRADA